MYRFLFLLATLLSCAFSLGATNMGSPERVTELTERDPYGLVMTLTAMMVVFGGLALLYLLFFLLGKTAQKLSARRLALQEGRGVEAPAHLGYLPGNVVAAISLALGEELSAVHDHENAIITIARVKRTYSPWSSKAHNMRQRPTITKARR